MRTPFLKVALLYWSFALKEGPCEGKSIHAELVVRSVATAYFRSPALSLPGVDQGDRGDRERQTAGGERVC